MKKIMALILSLALFLVAIPLVKQDVGFAEDVNVSSLE